MCTKVWRLAILGVAVTGMLSLSRAATPGDNGVALLPAYVVEQLETPLSSYSGWGAVELLDTGEWLINIYDTDEVVVIAPTGEVGNFPDFPVTVEGDIDIIQDGTDVQVIIMTAQGKYYAATLTVEEVAATALADQLNSFDMGSNEVVASTPGDDAGGVARDNNGACLGGSCACHRKCGACCPDGHTAYCNCRGTGVCRCIITPTK